MSSFDIAAQNYDADFTHSPIGRLQRKIVWNYLEKNVLNSRKNLRILEFNGGTGEDAIWFAEHGHHVVCTDLSQEMLAVAKSKAAEKDLGSSIEFKKLDFLNLEALGEEKFDLVFSNFAGLNCIDKEELKQFFQNSQSHMTDNARFIGVFLGRFCLWETLYFLLKGDRKNAYRRSSKDAVIANVDGEKVETWYYSSEEIEKISNEYFEKIQVKPIGALVPPSYLNPFFKNKLGFLNLLNGLDEKVSGISSFSAIADHYLIDLKRNSPQMNAEAHLYKSAGYK